MDEPKVNRAPTTRSRLAIRKTPHRSNKDGKDP